MTIVHLPLGRLFLALGGPRDETSIKCVLNVSGSCVLKQTQAVFCVTGGRLLGIPLALKVKAFPT